MSKKSRRRNKRLLMLAALAGGAAFMGRGKKKFGTDAGFLKSGAAGGASLSSPPILGTDHIQKAPIIKKDVMPVKKKSLYTDKGITVGTGVHRDESGISKPAIYPGSDALSRGVMAQIAQAKANAPKNIYPPGMIKMPIRKHGRMVNQGTTLRAKGGRIGANKGGSVTGIAKRGFGRALKKGKK